MIQLQLPYPPSVNHYWRHVGPRVLISKEGRDYRERVRTGVVMGWSFRGIKSRIEGELAILVRLHPPDRRRRDIDNTLKAILDALQYASVYDDDSQISRLTVERAEPQPPTGCAVVEIHERAKE